MHEVVAAEIEPLGEALHGQLLLQVGGDVFEDLLNLGVHPVAVPLLLGGAAAEDVPVYADEQLLAERVRQTAGSELLRPQGFLQALNILHVLQTPLRVGAQQVKAPVPDGVEAGVQGLFRVAPVRQPLPAQPDHNPFIGLRGVDDGPVDHVVLHQQHVPGAEKIGHALHHIGNLAAQQQDQLVKFVVVVVQLWRAAVLQVKQAEALVKIAPLSHLAPIQHGFTSGCLSVEAL